GLNQDDFTLLDNGKPQKISVFAVKEAQISTTPTRRSSRFWRRAAVSTGSVSMRGILRVEGDRRRGPASHAGPTTPQFAGRCRNRAACRDQAGSGSAGLL